MRSKILAIISLLFVTAALSTGVAAQNKADKAKSKELRAAVDRVDAASAVINEIMRVSDRSIPRDLLNRSQAIVVFPGALKGAFIVGGQGGGGVVIRRTATGWTAPAFLNMGGASVGFQIGGQKTDYVLVVMNDKGLKNLLQDKFEMGGEGSVAAGPVGRTSAASTNATLDAEILTYSRSKGLFAGISLKGVVITQDTSMNQAVYEKNANQILGPSPVLSTDAPGPLQKFSKTVGTYVR